MVDFFYQIDLWLFYLINHTIANPFFDKFFPFITEVKNWYLVYLIFWLILLIKGGKKGRIVAITAIVLITFSDQLNSFVLKDFFGRIRPCNALEDARILAGCTGSFSFPSSHAVNNFAVALFFLRLYPAYSKGLLTAAVLVTLSRTYVGVHYPSDIIAGALIGWAIGYGFSFIVDKIIKKYTIHKL